MCTPLDRYILYTLFQFEEFSGISGLIYTPYEVLYKLASPAAFHASSIRHSINDLERAGLLEKMHRDQTMLFTLTDEGKSRARELYRTVLTTNNHPQEVPFWWAIIFDIPESKRDVRDSLRSTLRDFGFVSWQKSVYIYPGGTPSDKTISELVQKPTWKEFVSLFSIDKVAHGANLMELAKAEWEIAQRYAKAMDIVNKAEDVVKQSGKKALNKHQITSLRNNGQKLLKELFEVIDEIRALPESALPKTPNKKIVRTFYDLSTSLVKL